jgi:uncharacterized membrane protein
VADIRPSDRELYLARVAAALRMPDATTREITEELAAHLADARDALVEAGLTIDHADREALARLGNPEDLANGVRRAHQTRRRLATAIGPAVGATIRGAVVGYFFGIGLLTLAAILAVVVIGMIGSTLHLSFGGYDKGWYSGPVTLFVVAYAGHGIPRVFASRSERWVEDVRFPIGLIGAIAVAVIALFVIRLPLDAGTVAVLALTPVAFTVGAVAASDRPRRRLPIAVFGGLLVLATIASVAAGLVTARWNGDHAFDGPTAPSLGVSAWDAPVAEDAKPSGGGLTWYGDVPLELSAAWDTDAGRSAWRDIRAEVWRSGPPERPNLLDSAPVMVVAASVDSPQWASATVTLPSATDRTWYRVALTGLGPDGRRYVLADGGEPTKVDYVGSAWDWLTSR